jgi:diacylglycerol O-acyltransferase / trehalose O-mycolyltransferase
LSSTGGTAIDYAIQAPGLYKAVGSYSGFPSVSDPDQAQQVSLTLSGGGASAENMWGPLGGPGWVAHDPSKNAAKGVAVYAAASAGGEGDVVRPEGSHTRGLFESEMQESWNTTIGRALGV